MLKRAVTYEDFDGNETTDILYFNLTKSEIIDLQISYDGGLDAAIKRIVEAKDIGSLIKEFKTIILAAYGKKSDDGKKFVKNDEIREEFQQTAAYDALFMELATDDSAAAEFIIGILPKDTQDQARKDIETIEPGLRQAPPVPPTTNS